MTKAFNLSQVVEPTGSTYVGDTSTLSGAVARTVSAKLSDMLSVKDFGAKGDGVTDDTTAITNAINAAYTVHGEVFFPAGIYMTTGLSFTTTLPGCRLHGVGSSGSIIKALPGATSPIFLLTHPDGSIGPNEWSFNGLQFMGNGTAASLDGVTQPGQNATNVAAFAADNLVRCEFYDVYFSRSQIGLVLSGAVEVSFAGCFFIYNIIGAKLWTDVGRPLPHNPCNLVSFRDTPFTSNWTWGIVVDGVTGDGNYSNCISFDACDIEGNGVLNTNSGAATFTQYSNNIVLNSCWIENNYGGIIDSSMFSKYADCFFTLTQGNATYGIDLHKLAGNYALNNCYFHGYPASNYNVIESHPDVLVLAGNYINNSKGTLGAPLYNIDATKTYLNYTVGGAGTGSVTTVSVVTANGLAGTVATATSTPAITLTTSVTGILKGNGTAISAAINSDLPVMTATVGGAVPTPPNNTTTYLRGDGTFAAPAGSGTVTSVSGTGTVSGLSLSGTVTTTGNLTLGGTLAIGFPGWTAPTLLNSWANVGTGYSPAGWYKGVDGRVYLRGCVTSGTNINIFDLPAGNRPAYIYAFAVPINSAFGVVIVNTLGEVNTVGATGVPVFLDGISFQTN